MFQETDQQSIPISTQRVIARLQAEGWVECFDLGFPALSQHAIADIREFILAQLQNAGGWMWLSDLQLSALVFSILTHQFEVHPQMRFMLKRLETERSVEIKQHIACSQRSARSDMAVFLNVAPNVATSTPKIAISAVNSKHG